MKEYKIVPKSGMAIFEKGRYVEVMIGSLVKFKTAGDYINLKYPDFGYEVFQPRDEHLETTMQGEKFIFDKVDDVYMIKGDAIDKIKVITLHNSHVKM